MKAKNIPLEDSPRIKALRKYQLILQTRHFKERCWGLDQYATRLYKKLLEIKSEQIN